MAGQSNYNGEDLLYKQCVHSLDVCIQVHLFRGNLLSIIIIIYNYNNIIITIHATIIIAIVTFSHVSLWKTRCFPRRPRSGPLLLSRTIFSLCTSRLRMSSCLLSSYSSATIDAGGLLFRCWGGREEEPRDPELKAALETVFFDVLCVVPSRLVTLGGGLEAESAIMVGRGFLEEAEVSRCTPPSRLDTRPLLPLVDVMDVETVSGQSVTPLLLDDPPPPPPWSPDLVPSRFLIGSLLPKLELELTSPRPLFDSLFFAPLLLFLNITARLVPGASAAAPPP